MRLELVMRLLRGWDEVYLCGYIFVRFGGKVELKEGVCKNVKINYKERERDLELYLMMVLYVFWIRLLMLC